MADTPPRTPADTVVADGSRGPFRFRKNKARFPPRADVVLLTHPPIMDADYHAVKDALLNVFDTRCATRRGTRAPCASPRARALNRARNRTRRDVTRTGHPGKKKTARSKQQRPQPRASGEGAPRGKGRDAAAGRAGAGPAPS